MSANDRRYDIQDRIREEESDNLVDSNESENANRATELVNGVPSLANPIRTNIDPTQRLVKNCSVPSFQKMDSLLPRTLIKNHSTTNFAKQDSPPRLSQNGSASSLKKDTAPRLAKKDSVVRFSEIVDKRELPRSNTATRPLGSPNLAERSIRQITRIPTEIKLKTITHLVKRPAVDIEFHDLVYNIKTASGSRTLIKGISGIFESGKLSVIMGPSGAGKSTLMNVLIGYVASGVRGTILTNGYPRKLHLFHKLSSYIMQEDLLQPNLTVYESTLFAAHLKLGDELTIQDKKNAVNEIIESMGLKSCQNVMVEKLSGGQRKRTSIALELVNNPPVIFLDEPTTGLDTVTTGQCIELLRDLAGQGRTIVCTLHQPSSSLFHMLDHVYVLAMGRCCYQGTPAQLVPFLSNLGMVCPQTHNPADYVLEILEEDRISLLSNEIQNGKIFKREQTDTTKSPTCVTKLCRKETLSVMPNVYDHNDNHLQSQEIQFPCSATTQFNILLRRKMLQISRNTLSLWIQLLHHLFSALFVGALFIGVGNDASRPFDNFKFCISVLVFFMYTHTMAPILLWPVEIKLLEREYFNRWYGLKPFYCVTILASLPSIVIFGFIFDAAVYFMTDQPPEIGRFLMFCLIGLFSAAISESIGICIGSIVSREAGTIITPAVLAPFLAVAVYGMGFGQFIEPLMEFLMSLSYMRYLLVATCVTLYKDREELLCPPDQQLCLYQDAETLLRDLGMEGKTNLNQFFAMINFLILFRVMAFLALRYRLNKELSNQVMTHLKKLMKPIIELR